MNIQAMMAQAKKMQAEMEKAQKELEQKEFVVEKQGIKLVLFGNRYVKQVLINEAIIDPEDKDIIEDLILIAFNEAMNLISEEENKIKSSMNPGMPF